MIAWTDPDLPHLAEQHRAKLGSSAIAPHVAEARGYRSVTVKAELLRLGFAASLVRIPALLLRG
jgi:hypothetical protein